ncbi:MAG: 30S ribosomal protein S18 [Chloroflexi bacterium]|nr:30S ribosomal protein S18 [Chloroflexota bacterium]
MEPGAPRPPGDGASVEARQERPRRFESSRGDRDGDRNDDDRDRRGGGGGGGGGGRRYFGRRKVCTFCVDKATSIDYKDPAKLRRFVSDRGRIEGRRRTGTCAKHQRWLATALKRARHLALLPYAPEHIRLTGAFASRR